MTILAFLPKFSTIRAAARDAPNESKSEFLCPIMRTLRERVISPARDCAIIRERTLEDVSKASVLPPK